MTFIVPELRARDALAAMEECLLDDDDHREIGHPALVHHGAPDGVNAHQQRPAGHPKRLALARNEENQADAGIVQNVVEGVDAAIAETIRNGKRGVIERPDETCMISLRREIDHAERIGRADHDEWRCRENAPTMAISSIENLAGEPSV